MEDDFITNAETKINKIINDLGWSIEYFQTPKPVSMICCPNNSAHTMPPEKLESHLVTCDWATAGYKNYDLPLSLSESTSSFIQLTPDLQEKIIYEASLQDETFKKAELASDQSKPRPIPMSSSRLMQNFTSDERRAMYDYVISNTESSVKIIVPANVAPLKTEEKRELTKLEILSAERDAKRRRATYRNKVHTNRKTHVEIMREVIDSQMNCLLDESTESSNKKENKIEKGEKGISDSEDRRKNRPESSYHTHKSSKTSRRDKYHESTDHSHPRSNHRSRSDNRYYETDRKYQRPSEKEYTNIGYHKRKHDEMDKRSDEKRKKHKTKEFLFDPEDLQVEPVEQNLDFRALTQEFENEFGSAGQNLIIEKHTNEKIKKEKKQKKDKHKKHKKKKKKKHKKKNSSSSSSDSD